MSLWLKFNFIRSNSVKSEPWILVDAYEVLHQENNVYVKFTALYDLFVHRVKKLACQLFSARVVAPIFTRKEV